VFFRIAGGFKKMEFLSGGIAVVTGAGSGIGRTLAMQLSAAGSGLALADVDEKSLVETAAMLPGKGAGVSMICAGSWGSISGERFTALRIFCRS
jgi:NAD(P)-dependent dehydrogenase (short-subunit alcohol dehydrogenase family)